MGKSPVMGACSASRSALVLMREGVIFGALVLGCGGQASTASTFGDVRGGGLAGGDAAIALDAPAWAPGTSASEPEPGFIEDDLKDATEAVATESPDVSGGTEDVRSAERAPLDLPPDDVHVNVDEDTAEDICPGGIGCPCGADEECDYPLCVQTTNGDRVCTGECTDACPSPLTCLPPVTGSGPWLCLDDSATDCMPCMSSTTCSQQGMVDAVCAIEDVEIGAFCGRRCESDEDCGPGAGCAPGLLAETGQAVSRCKPVGDATCECNSLALGLAAETSCAKGPWCTGVRRCTPDGLSECAIPDEGAEQCDGLDNDCDGEIDDVPPTPCWPEKVDGLVQGGSSICHPGYRLCGECLDHQGPTEEACDQLDNDCDGVVDEGPVLECVPPGTPKWLLYGEGSRCQRGKSACGGPCIGFVGPQPDFCNGLDEDCDGQTDEGYIDIDVDGVANCVDNDDDDDGIVDAADVCPELADPQQADLDGDGVGDGCDTDDDGDGDFDDMDCAPLDEARHVQALEVCNGIDDNCDGHIDYGLPDLDADGLMDLCDPDRDGDGDLDAVDCAPDDAARGPSAVERCNTSDDDCDGLPDDGLPDFDQDGSGDSCDPDRDGDGNSNIFDCAPDDPVVYRNAVEICNGRDENCDSFVDNGSPDLDWDGLRDDCDPDQDGDGDPDVTDCDPHDRWIYSGAVEICDGRDEDCSGVMDDGLPDLDGDGLMDECDSDRDGDGASNDTDCAMADPTRYPGAPEECNGLDDDCDSFGDEDFNDLDHDGLGDACDWDRDGDGRPNGFDCAPDDWSRHPGRAEECNYVDDDCDGLIDDGPDLNGDGDWDACDRDADDDGIRDDADCAPNDAEVPVVDERCNGKDDNCNGLIDEGGPDLDGDGIGWCDLDDDQDGWELPLDCAPLRPEAWPGAPEQCNGLDDDCDGVADNLWLDSDLDGFGDDCDHDDDGDGDLDSTDCAPLDPARSSFTPGGCS
ncbi:MAG: hypothetical protein IV100_03125 [Myxococcales bacterium]|nr:hypothetical protein [Myxococcales bacterium]